jgi:hypothetical protein
VGRGAAKCPRGSRQTPLSAFVDINILVRHLTGTPPDMAARATAALAGEDDCTSHDTPSTGFWRHVGREFPSDDFCSRAQGGHFFSGDTTR